MWNPSHSARPGLIMAVSIRSHTRWGDFHFVLPPARIFVSLPADLVKFFVSRINLLTDFVA